MRTSALHLRSGLRHVSVQLPSSGARESCCSVSPAQTPLGREAGRQLRSGSPLRAPGAARDVWKTAHGSQASRPIMPALHAALLLRVGQHRSGSRSPPGPRQDPTAAQALHIPPYTPVYPLMPPYIMPGCQLLAPLRPTPLWRRRLTAIATCDAHPTCLTPTIPSQLISSPASVRGQGRHTSASLSSGTGCLQMQDVSQGTVNLSDA